MPAAVATTYTVTTTADSGAGSLRQAITDANANPGRDTIAFNITGSGVHTILIASALPAITSPVTLDGYTQPGTSANTLPVGQGLNTVLKIEISAEGLFFPGGGCVQVQASDTTIRGLAITNCDVGNASGIYISNAPTNVRIEGNFLAVAPDGVTRTDQGFAKQVLVTGGTNIVVGGTTAASRNLIAACQSGVDFSGSGHTVAGNLFGLTAAGDALLTPACGSFAVNLNGSGHLAHHNVIAGGSNGFSVNGSGHTIRSNFVGTDVTGTVLFGLGEHAFGVAGTDHVIGGAGPGEGNVIGGAGFYYGIELAGSGHVVYGNFVGTDVTGTIDLGNTRAGIAAGGTN